MDLASDLNGARIDPLMGGINSQLKITILDVQLNTQSKGVVGFRFD